MCISHNFNLSFCGRSVRLDCDVCLCTNHLRVWCENTNVWVCVCACLFPYWFWVDLIITRNILWTPCKCFTSGVAVAVAPAFRSIRFNFMPGHFSWFLNCDKCYLMFIYCLHFFFLSLPRKSQQKRMTRQNKDIKHSLVTYEWKREAQRNTCVCVCVCACVCTNTRAQVHMLYRIECVAKWA